MKKILPVGSVVYLKEGSTPVVVIAVAQFAELPQFEKKAYFDYVASIYPQGLEIEQVYYFNHEDIATVEFTGYESEQHDRYIKAIEEWKENHGDEFVVGVSE